MKKKIKPQRSCNETKVTKNVGWGFGSTHQRMIGWWDVGVPLMSVSLSTWQHPSNPHYILTLWQYLLLKQTLSNETFIWLLLMDSVFTDHWWSMLIITYKSILLGFKPTTISCQLSSISYFYLTITQSFLTLGLTMVCPKNIVITWYMCKKNKKWYSIYMV